MIVGSLPFCVMTITHCRMPRGHMISVLSHAVWWVKLEINKTVKHDNNNIIIMTQIAG